MSRFVLVPVLCLAAFWCQKSAESCTTPQTLESLDLRGGDTYCAVPYMASAHGCNTCVKASYMLAVAGPMPGMEYSIPVWLGCREWQGDEQCMTSSCFTTRCFKIDTPCSGLAARYYDPGCFSLESTFINSCGHSYQDAQTGPQPGGDCSNIQWGLY